jgi:hypothetical protein
LARTSAGSAAAFRAARSIAMSSTSTVALSAPVAVLYSLL